MSTPSSHQAPLKIAGGGGNPDDSIFKGEVELAQMKMTRDNEALVSRILASDPAASVIDLNGLDISGTVDAAFYRAGTEVPGSVLTLPDIGSSNNLEETEDQTADSTEENIGAASTRQSRQQARKQARLAAKEIEETTDTTETVAATTDSTDISAATSELTSTSTSEETTSSSPALQQIQQKRQLIQPRSLQQIHFWY